MEGRLLRITVPDDTFKIISVGPIQERNLINSIANGRFIPINNPVTPEIDIDPNIGGMQP